MFGMVGSIPPPLLRAQVRFSHMDMSTAVYLDVATGELKERTALLRKLGKTRSRENSKDKGV